VLPIRSKNLDPVIEQVAGSVGRVPEVLSDSPWDDAGDIATLLRFVGAHSGSPGNVLVVDDTGSPQRGLRAGGGPGLGHTGAHCPLPGGGVPGVPLHSGTPPRSIGGWT